MTHLIMEDPYILDCMIEAASRGIIRKKLHAGLLDSYEGALLGVLVGDTLGLPFENMTAAEVMQERRGRPLKLEPFMRMNQSYDTKVNCPAGSGSDDSTQTILLAELLAVYGCDPRKQFEAYRDGFFKGKGIPFPKNIGWGPSTIGKLSEPFSFDDTSCAQPDGLITDGSLMRTAPVALWQRGNLIETMCMAGVVSSVTHNSVIARELCAAYSVMLGWSLDGQKPAEVVTAIRTRSHLFGQETQDVLHTDFATYRGPQSGEEMYHARTAFSVAVWAWSTSNTFEQAIDKAVSAGGDTDTNAAIAGALSGATYGRKGIPQQWLEGQLPRARARFERAALALLFKNIQGSQCGS